MRVPEDLQRADTYYIGTGPAPRQPFLRSRASRASLLHTSLRRAVEFRQDGRCYPVCRGQAGTGCPSHACLCPESDYADMVSLISISQRIALHEAEGSTQQLDIGGFASQE